MMLKHLKELIVDIEHYGWEPIRAYHAVWLQHLKNGMAECADYEVKVEFRRSLVWHLVSHDTKVKH